MLTDGGVVDSALNQYVAGKDSAKAEIIEAGRKAREERDAARKRTGTEDDADCEKKEKDKGKRKGKDGREDAPP